MFGHNKYSGYQKKSAQTDSDATSYATINMLNPVVSCGDSDPEVDSGAMQTEQDKAVREVAKSAKDQDSYDKIATQISNSNKPKSTLKLNIPTGSTGSIQVQEKDFKAITVLDLLPKLNKSNEPEAFEIEYNIWLKEINNLLDRNPSIPHMVRCGLLANALGCKQYTNILKDMHPAIQHLIRVEKAVARYERVAELLKQIPEKLGIPTELSMLSNDLAIHCLDASKAGYDAREDIVNDYYATMAISISHFYSKARELSKDPKRLVLWKESLNIQLLKSSPIEAKNLQFLVQQEIKKYRDKDSLSSIMEVKILELYAAWAVLVNALDYRETRATGLPVKDLLESLSSYDNLYLLGNNPLL